MQVSIWNDYLTKLDKKMQLQNYHILLLTDNAPMHIIDENVNLTNVTVYFYHQILQHTCNLVTQAL